VTHTNNTEKSKVIASKLDLHIHDWKFNKQLSTDGFRVYDCECGKRHESLSGTIPTSFDINFFNSEGQIVLLDWLNDIGNPLGNNTRVLFAQWLENNDHIIMTNNNRSLFINITIIAETKLASLFYEFIMEEKAKEITREVLEILAPKKD